MKQQVFSQNSYEIQGNLFAYAEKMNVPKEKSIRKEDPLCKAVNSIAAFFCGDEVCFDAVTKPIKDLL